ncbi:MAG: HD domain-containing protein [Nitrospirae bacterium]|nr:HD domain-containing protein [Nitrospirota bacterium]
MGEVERIKKFISIFQTTISTCSLYSKNHISLDDMTQKAFSILNELLTEQDSLKIMIVENDLIVDNNPLRDTGIHTANLIKRFKRKGISRVDFLKGVTFSEIKQFIVDLSETDKGLKTYPNIKTGVIDVRLGGLMVDADFDINDLPRFTSEQVETVKEVYHDISYFRRLNTAGLEEIVVNFIVTFRKAANILQLISPVRSYSEYTYTHATNVAVLSMFQAESLGVTDELLRDIGIAALLHDVGKLFISNEILEKNGPLDEDEWDEIRRHTLYGARYLTRTDGLTHLAPIVALEHHLRYNGQGYPKLNVTSKRQHICSQIVAISDFFDAMRSRRPYRRELETKEILSLMKTNADTEFNPFLLDNFLRIIVLTLKEK